MFKAGSYEPRAWCFRGTNLEPITGTNESKSSVKVNLTAKGEAQVEVKVYEGERSSQYALNNDGVPVPLEKIIEGDDLAEATVERLANTINSLERQRIKVVGRELPEVSNADAG